MPDRGTWVREAERRLSAVRFPGATGVGENALRQGADGNVEAGLDSPRLSAELLLRHVLGISRVELAAYPEKPVPEAALGRLEGLLRRRLQGEPVAYLLGTREFFGRDFHVSPATLIPRPETEHLIEAALAAFPDASRKIRFADLGTGSGCIAVTLCAERPAWQGIALDLSGRALAVARRNAARHKIHRLLFTRADFTACPLAADSLDLVVSNPPYVSRAEYATLSPEVRDFEPVSALVPAFADDGGRSGHSHDHEALSTLAIQSPQAPRAALPPLEPAGLEHLQAVAKAAFSALKPGGLLLMEHGQVQGAPFH